MTKDSQFLNENTLRPYGFVAPDWLPSGPSKNSNVHNWNPGSAKNAAVAHSRLLVKSVESSVNIL